jgi:Ser/Thr protein kinase RdoA (MazF antagonist)
VELSRPAPEEAAAVLAEFGIAPERVAAIEDLDGGFANWSYKVRCAAGEEYVLTYCVGGTLEDTEVLASVLSEVGRAGIPTNALIRTTGGGPIARRNGVGVLLKEYLPGGVLEEPRADLARRAGRALGALGDVAPPPGIRAHHSYGLQLVDDLTPEELAGAGAWFPAQVASLRERRPPEGRNGLIHGDLFPDNMVVGPGGEVALIDFEEACCERLMLDVGMACVGLAAAFGATDEAASALDAFVAGYRERQPVIAGELLELAYYMEVAATMTALWRHGDRVAHGPRSRASDPAEMVAIAEEVRRGDGVLGRAVAAAAD